MKSDLSLSDHQAFLLVSELNKKNDYPESFRFTNIRERRQKKFDLFTFRPLGCPRKVLIEISVNNVLTNSFAMRKIERILL